MVNVQTIDGGSPVGNGHFIINLQGLKTKLLHPHRIILFLRQLVHNFRGQTLFHTISIFFFITDIIDAAVNIIYLTFFSHFTHTFLSGIHGCPKPHPELFLPGTN